MSLVMVLVAALLGHQTLTGYPDVRYVPAAVAASGNALVAASEARAKNSRLGALAPNTALSLGIYNPPPLAGCNSPGHTITDYSRLTYDSANHQILMFGGGHAATPRTDVDIFNPNTLTWRSAYPSTPVSEMTVANLNYDTGAWITTGHPTSRHTYDMLTFAPNLGELILLKQTDTQPRCIEPYQWQQHPGKVWHYSPISKKWRPSAASPVWRNFLTASEYDPLSGKIILIDGYGLYSYDPIAELAVKHQSFVRGDLGYSQNLVYFPPNKKMYYVKNDGAVFEVNLDRTNLANSTILPVNGITGMQPSGGETGWAYDAVNAVIGGGIVKGVFYALDPIAKTWTARTMQVATGEGPIGTLAYHCIDYDPVNNVFIFIGRVGARYATWAYRYGNTTSIGAVSDPAHVPNGQERLDTKRIAASL